MLTGSSLPSKTVPSMGQRPTDDQRHAVVLPAGYRPRRDPAARISKRDRLEPAPLHSVRRRQVKQQDPVTPFAGQTHVGLQEAQEGERSQVGGGQCPDDPRREICELPSVERGRSWRVVMVVRFRSMTR